jgi:hypothetical protein
MENHPAPGADRTKRRTLKAGHCRAESVPQLLIHSRNSLHCATRTKLAPEQVLDIHQVYFLAYILLKGKFLAEQIMKRVHKIYGVLLALVAVSAIAVPLVIDHGEQGSRGDQALQLDSGNSAGASGQSGADGVGHAGSRAGVIGASFAELEHFSFVPVMADAAALETGSDGAASAFNLSGQFAVAASGGNASGAGAAASHGGSLAGYGFSAAHFSRPFSSPLPSGSFLGGLGSGAFVPLALSGNDGGDTSGGGGGGGGGSQDGSAGAAPDDSGDAYAPVFTAPVNGGLPDGPAGSDGGANDVPEPAPLALLGLGLFAYAALRRSDA